MAQQNSPGSRLLFVADHSAGTALSNISNFNSKVVKIIKLHSFATFGSLFCVLCFIWVFVQFQFSWYCKSVRRLCSARLMRWYTLWAIKRATLFLIITLAFLGQFLYFLHQWKRTEYSTRALTKFYHFTLTVSPRYLVKLKRHSLNSTFWSQSSQCVWSNRLLET